MKPELQLSPTPPDRILQTVTRVVLDLHEQMDSIVSQVDTIFTNFISHLDITVDGAEYDHVLENEFWEALYAIDDLVQPPTVITVIQQLSSRSAVHPDWDMFGAFLAHDLGKLSISHILELIGFIETQSMHFDQHHAPVHKKRKLYAPQLELLKQVQQNIRALIKLGMYPLEFVQNILRVALDELVPTEQVRLVELFQPIALAVSIMNYQDEYEIVVGSTTNTHRNTIFIDIAPDLVIEANSSMIFGIIYNILKNAAKANGQKHDDTNDVALEKRYKNKGELVQPLHIAISAQVIDSSVEISITDYGSGISLDKSLNRFQEQLRHRLFHAGPTAVTESEWYRIIKSAVGQDQAKLLLDWPTNSDAILDVLVRTIFILQFVSGFKGESWEIRSLSSGTGLWGVWYILNTLGGDIIATNTFEKGAQFKVVLPTSTVLPSF